MSRVVVLSNLDNSIYKYTNKKILLKLIKWKLSQDIFNDTLLFFTRRIENIFLTEIYNGNVDIFSPFVSHSEYVPRSNFQRRYIRVFHCLLQCKITVNIKILRHVLKLDKVEGRFKKTYWKLFKLLDKDRLNPEVFIKIELISKLLIEDI